MKVAAACAVVSLCTLVPSLPANAGLAFNWSFTNDFGVPETGGTTSGTITGLEEGTNDLSESGISLTVNQSRNVPLSTLSSGPGDGTGTITVSGGNIIGYEFSLQTGNLSFQASLDQYAFYIAGDTYDYYNGNGNIFSSSSPTPVPGPIPLLGAGAAFAWSRKLRRRISTCRFRF